MSGVSYHGLPGCLSKQIDVLDRRGSEKVGSVQSSRDRRDFVHEREHRRELGRDMESIDTKKSHHRYTRYTI
jgi:hypothetical protein